MTFDIMIGKQIKARRNALNLTREELGNKLNLSSEQIQKFEDGEAPIGASQLFNLAQTLDTDISFFCEIK